jgi:hypothetical protein
LPIASSSWVTIRCKGTNALVTTTDLLPVPRRPETNQSSSISKSDRGSRQFSSGVWTMSHSA